ncbi:hypothetical protein QR97_02605 [Streptomyces sp. PBH53]|nr:hypothetical protein QR97_02605 [Streptomyces sp. PBH53]
MREILAVLDRWYAARVRFGLATVVSVSHSAPRGPGAALAVGPDGEVVGSVSGGCVEGAVSEPAQEVGTPEEVAVSVAAEIVALRWGGSGAPLSTTRGAIHPPGAP